MSVSLVKVYFTAGWATPGCLPESDPTLFTSLDDAREYIADELDRAADEMFATELDNARLDYAGDEEAYRADIDAAHELSTSISGTAEIVRNDRDGDVTWQAMHGEWSSSEPDGYVYFIGRI